MELNNEELRGILSNWGIRLIVSIQKTSEGVANDNWIIKTNSNKLILRCANSERTVKDLTFEFNVLKKLIKSKFGCNIPSPLMTIRKKSIVIYKKRLLWCYNFIEGETFTGIEDVSKLKQVAKMMASLHKKLAKMQIKGKRIMASPYDCEWLIKELYKSKRDASKRRDKPSALFLKYVDKLVFFLRNLNDNGYNILHKQIIHADINGENLVFNKGRLTGLLDFDNCKIGAKIMDIAVFMQYECRKNKKSCKLDFKKVHLFIKEYRKHNMLTAKELSFLPDLFLSETIDAFNYQYWLYIHDRTKFKFEKLKKYALGAIWFAENKGNIIFSLV